MNDYFDLVENQLGELIEQGAHRRARVLIAARLPRIPVGTFALVASTALALAVAAVVLVSLHRGAAPQPAGAGVRGGEIDPSLVRSFRILRRPLASADRLPAGFADGGVVGVRRGMFPRSTAWLTSQPAPPSIASIGLLPAFTQRTTIPGTRFAAWLIPGRHGMCWFTDGGPFPAFPNPAVCVGSLEHPATALIDGPWTDVENAGQNIVGLVTDRVRSVMLLEGGHAHRVPLHDGFYVSPLPTGSERLVAVTRGGTQPLYPQRIASPPVILGNAEKTIARSSRPAVVLTGSPGLHVQLMSEMTCMKRHEMAGGPPSSSESPAKGYQHQATYRVPALVPLAFPAGSSNLPACYVNTSASVAAHAPGTVQVTIIDH